MHCQGNGCWMLGLYVFSYIIRYLNIYYNVIKAWNEDFHRWDLNKKNNASNKHVCSSFNYKQDSFDIVQEELSFMMDKAYAAMSGPSYVHNSALEVLQGITKLEESFTIRMKGKSAYLCFTLYLFSLQKLQ